MSPFISVSSFPFHSPPVSAREMASKLSRYGYNTVDPGNLVRVKYRDALRNAVGVVIDREVFSIRGGRCVEVTVLIDGKKKKFSESLLEIVPESKVYMSPSVT